MTGWVASLPMYDLPEVRSALDSLWSAIARRLASQGIADVPGQLTHDRHLHDLWSDPVLFLSQCCGYDLNHRYAAKLQPIATPRYTAPGCKGCHYASVVIVREDSSAATIEDLRDKVCVINGPESHSGMNSLRALVAPLNLGGRFFATVHSSGSHSGSLDIMRCGEADVTAVDCVTYELLARHRPDAVDGTRKLCFTRTAPGVPFVTRTCIDPFIVACLQTAVLETLHDPGLAAAHATLLIDGAEVVALADFDRIIEFEQFAAEYGYPTLR